jgi:hypothetical protein
VKSPNRFVSSLTSTAAVEAGACPLAVCISVSQDITVAMQYQISGMASA